MAKLLITDPQWATKLDFYTIATTPLTGIANIAPPQGTPAPPPPNQIPQLPSPPDWLLDIVKGVQGKQRAGGGYQLNVEYPATDPASWEAYQKQVKIIEGRESKYDDYYNTVKKYIDEENERRSQYNQAITRPDVAGYNAKDVKRATFASGEPLPDWTDMGYGVNPLTGIVRLTDRYLPYPEYKPVTGLPVYQPSQQRISVGASVSAGSGTPKQQKAVTGLPVAVFDQNTGTSTNKTWTGSSDQINLNTLAQVMNQFINTGGHTTIASNIDQVFSGNPSVPSFMRSQQRFVSYTPSKDTFDEYNKNIVHSLNSWLLKIHKEATSGALKPVGNLMPPDVADLASYLKKGSGDWIEANPGKITTTTIDPETGQKILSFDAGKLMRMMTGVSKVVDSWLLTKLSNGKTQLESLTNYVEQYNPSLVERFGDDQYASPAQSKAEFRRKFPTWLNYTLTMLIVTDLITGQHH